MPTILCILIICDTTQHIHIESFLMNDNMKSEKTLQEGLCKR